MTESADTNLVAAALRGDAESFSRLCERYYPALVAIAYSHLADRGLAEDAAQETLLAAYRGISALKEPDRFAGWLTTICRNTAIDMAKTRVRTRHTEAKDCSPRPDTGGDESCGVTTVREIIQGLEPQMRDIVYLKYYNRMSYDQIARMLGISEEAVNGKLRRARAKIRHEMQRRKSMETEP